MRSVYVRLVLLILFASAVGATVSAEASPTPAASVEAGGASPDRSPRSLGPFNLTSADGTATIRFQFTGQWLVFYEKRDLGPTEDNLGHDYMRLRRIRPIISGNGGYPGMSFRLHFSMAPASIEVMDFYLNQKLRPGAELRFGQFKIPFTRYRIQSFSRLTLVDWAVVCNYFGGERQMGLALHNGFETPPEWGYVVGVFTGLNARSSYGTGIARVHQANVENPSDLAGSHSRASIQPEICVHLSRNANGISLQSDSDEKRGPFRYSVGLSAAWDIDPSEYKDFALRLAAEFLAKFRGLSFCGIGYAGYADLAGGSETDLAMTGLLIQAAYRADRWWEVSARYSVADITDEFNDTIRPDRTSIILRDGEVTGGVNVYFIGHSLKWQNDCGRLRREYRSGTRHDLLARSQLQLAF